MQRPYIALACFAALASLAISAPANADTPPAPVPSPSASYYPQVTGKISVPAGVPSANLRYKLEDYNLGGVLAVPKTRIFLSAGIVADHYLRKQNAVSDATHFSTHLGIGTRF
jgi:hypothetical protein